MSQFLQFRVYEAWRAMARQQLCSQLVLKIQYNNTTWKLQPWWPMFNILPLDPAQRRLKEADHEPCLHVTFKIPLKFEKREPGGGLHSTQMAWKVRNKQERILSAPRLQEAGQNQSAQKLHLENTRWTGHFHHRVDLPRLGRPSL